MNSLNLHIPTASKSHWEKIGFTKKIGTAVPLFSLRSNQGVDLGIGDFSTLKALIETCAEQHLDVIQLLPINETSPHDNSPFGAISAFALNPIYADMTKLFLEHMGEEVLAIINTHPKLLALYDKTTQNDRVSYTNSRALKYELFQICYNHFLNNPHNQEQKNTFHNFCEKNRYWINSYCLFKHLKDKYNWYAIKDWQPADRIYSDQLYRKYLHSNPAEMEIQAFIQWNIYAQCQALHQLATSKNILIKGDIPLLVSKESADVWQYPDYFDTQLKAGAPPDFYCEEGQDWGLPVYNWDALEKNDYEWWKKRLKYAEHFYDLYRIDHVLGLFRIWVIPEGKPATKGNFLPEDKTTWEAHGRKLLSLLLSHSHMLPIAEDLGVVPPMVRKVLTELGIPGYKVMLLEHQKPTEVFDPVSLLSTSTHDSATLLGLLANLTEKEKQAFFSAIGLMPTGTDEATIVYDHLLSKLMRNTPAAFIVLPLQDILGYIPGLIGADQEQERVNTPGTMGDHNWSYRLPPLDHPDVIKRLQLFAALASDARHSFSNWLTSNPTKEPRSISLLEFKKTPQHTFHDKKITLCSDIAGMARIILLPPHTDNVQIRDIPLKKLSPTTFGLTLSRHEFGPEFKITFYWRIDNDNYEWEGKDYIIKFI